MTTLKLLGLLLVVGVPGGAQIIDQSVCGATATAIRRAAEREAHADFWINIAKCLNATGFNFPTCRQEARMELEEALQFAEEQIEARLDACELLGQGPYDPQIDPDDFSPNVNNLYFPRVPGRTLIYEKQTEEGLEQVVVTTTNKTVEIGGVLCREVTDVVTLEGVLIEDTVDWYSQNVNGEAWYLGEIAMNFENGFLDNLDGSWMFGKNGAKPGVIMLTDPMPGDVYRQEFLVNEAEDIALVIARGVTVTVKAGTFTDCIQTQDWTPLEPGVFEHKFYAPGVGPVLEVNLETGEELELVQIIN